MTADGVNLHPVSAKTAPSNAMVLDLYNSAKDHPYYNKLVGTNYLLVEYNCPVQTEKFQLLSESHFIVYIVTGKKDFVSGDTVYACNAGDALFVKRGVYTTIQYFDVENCVMLFFVNDEFIRKFLTENSLGDTPDHRQSAMDDIFRIDVDDMLRSLFDSVFRYLEKGKEVPRNLVEIKFKELFFNVVMNPNNKKLAQYFSSLQHVSKTSLDEIMLKHFRYDLPLDEYAKLCGRSLSAFKRDFKSRYQQSPGRWLAEKRLEYARTLLLHSDMNVNQVCQESGFRDSTHFNKVFKEKYQLPPKQFRVSHGKVA